MDLKLLSIFNHLVPFEIARQWLEMRREFAIIHSGRGKQIAFDLWRLTNQFFLENPDLQLYGIIFLPSPFVFCDKDAETSRKLKEKLNWTFHLAFDVSSDALSAAKKSLIFSIFPKKKLL